MYVAPWRSLIGTRVGVCELVNVCMYVCIGVCNWWVFKQCRIVVIDSDVLVNGSRVSSSQM